MAITKKRKKRRKHYKTGIHKSSKCLLPIRYRSGWEKEVCKFLDASPGVLTYEYECVKIAYIANIRTGKVRTYYPDFLITYSNGDKKLVEVKRQDKLNDPKVIKKAEAAIKWCASQSPKIQYEFWSNTIIEAIARLNLASKPLVRPNTPQTHKRPQKGK